MHRLVAAGALLLAQAAQAGSEPGYLAELQRQARTKNLASEVYWHKLLHYRANHLYRGVTSTIDDPDFFLAVNGKTDPAAELDTTLASFFSEQKFSGEPAQCRKKARYQWLKRRLDFDPVRLPPQPCELFEQFQAGLRPATASLVFAASDLSNPSTMFGHTLLRLDGREQTREQRLLAHAVNYAAIVTSTNSFTYTLDGLAGGFVGQYSVHPYYERVKQYVRWENRDLWEYGIRLDAAELERLIWHLWELREVGSDYFFFTENCSYMLLTLLETAWDDERRPSTQFDGLIPLVIPIDTVRVLQRAGFLDDPELRPSMARTLGHKLDSLTATSYGWVLDYAASTTDLNDRRLTEAALREQARALEAANDYLNYRFQTGALERDAALPASREALLALSRLKAQSDFPLPPERPTPPHLGHGSTRASAGLRANRQISAALLRYRASYHDALDPPAAYLPGGQIESFDLGLLLRDAVRVSDLRLVAVQSLIPWDRAFRPWLWQVSTGFRRFGADTISPWPQSALGGYLDGGAGYAVGQAGRWTAYAFAFASVDVNKDAADGFAVATGLRSGLEAVWSSRWTQEFKVDYLGGIAGGGQRQLRLSLGTQWQFHPDHGIRLSLNRDQFDRVSARSAELRWQYYF